MYLCTNFACVDNPCPVCWKQVISYQIRP